MSTNSIKIVYCCTVTFGLEISFQALRAEGEMLIVFANTAKGATPRQCYTQKKMIFREFFYPDWRPFTCQDMSSVSIAKLV